MLLILSGLIQQFIYVMLVVRDISLEGGLTETTFPPKLLLIFFYISIFFLASLLVLYFIKLKKMVPFLNLTF
jgi:hypothetical protein